MVVFADTSALYALLDVASSRHQDAAGVWDEFRRARTLVATSNYVYVECVSLLQSRLGVSAARQFVEDLGPLLRVDWVDPDTHDAAVAALLTANRRDLSLVDCTSFLIMRRLGITRAFTLDDHFREQGFEVVP
jgi:predicted nucleic acid-binding protein